MKIYNMNDYFSETILQRGFNYYKRGKVISANKINNNTFIFDVAGSINYLVKINVHNNEYDMSCNCPYDGNCKHMAACLFYLKFTDEKNIEFKKDKKINTNLTPFDKFKLEVKQMVRECYGREGYIDYYSGDEFVEGIDNFAEKIRDSLDLNNLDIALKEIFYLYDTIENVDMDGSNGEHMMATDCVSDVLGLIFFMNSGKVTDELFKYFKKEKYVVELSNVVSEFEDNIHTKDDALKYLKLVETILDAGDDFGTYYLAYVYIRVYYDYIDEDEALKLAKAKLKRKYNSYIFSFLVEKYTFLKKYDEAISLLENNYGKNFDDGEVLLKLYLKNNNVDKYKKLLLKLYDEKPNYDYFMRIKKSFDKADFDKIKEKLLNEMKESQYYFKDYIKLCDELNDIDGLFDICKKKGLEYLSNYLNKIIKKHRAEALDIYKIEVKKLCDEARNRARYDKVIYYLMRLLDIPKAEGDVLEIINYVEINYPTRSVFLKELEFVKSKM